MKMTKEQLQKELESTQQAIVGATRRRQEAIQYLQTWNELKISVGLTFESIALRSVNNVFKKRLDRAEAMLSRWEKDVAKIEAKIIEKQTKGN